MWLLENPDLPTTALPESGGAPLCAIDLGTSLAPLCVLDLQASLTQPGVTLNFQPVTQAIALPATGTTISVTGLGSVDAVSHNGQTWVPAADPLHPTAGEFVYDAVAQTVTLTVDRSQQLAPGLPVQVLGRSLPFNPLLQPGQDTPPDPFETDWVDSSLFAVFFALPVLGEISWTLTAENHPSGSLKLRANAATIAEVRRRFQVGTEFSFAGIGFSVTSYRDTLLNVYQFPGIEYDIAISLGGKWQRKHYNRPVYLSPSAAKYALTGSTAPFLDADCGLVQTVDGATLPVLNKTTIAALAAQNGVTFTAAVPAVGESINDLDVYTVGGTPPAIQQQLYYRARSMALGAWDVQIQKDSPRTATAEWESAARELLRMNGTFIDWNSASAVSARDFYAVASWSYSLPAIDVSCKGDTEFSDGRIGYGMEFPATQLTGAFTEPAGAGGGEDTQGNTNVPGKWTYSPPPLTILWSGDTDAATCPSDLIEIKTMSLNAASSGRTTHQIKVQSAGGIELMREEWTYGLEYTSNAVIQLDGRLQGSPTSFWRVVNYQATQAVIDPSTRYVLGSRSLGSKRGAFRTETDALERQKFTSTDKEYRLYEYQDIPILALEGKVLAQFASFYSDAARESPPFEQVKRCNPDGTSSIQYVPDPNYAYPMFEFAKRSYRSSFVHTEDPENQPEAPKPDLIQGEETDSYTVLQLVPKGSTPAGTGLGGDGEQEGFVEYVSEASSQGQQFGEYTLRRTFADHEGRPSPAQRAANLYTKNPPDDGITIKTSYTRGPTQYQYILCTPGHQPNQPTGGTLNYPRAQFYSQAFLGARTELHYRDITESADFSFSIPFNAVIRPLDKVAVEAAGDAYQLRVTSINHKVALQGQLNGYPLCVSEGTQIGGGIDREVPFTMTKRLPPKPPIPPTPARKPGANPPYGLTLGDLGFNAIPNRANYAGKKPAPSTGV